MSWRTVVVSNNAKLDYQLGYLVVRGRETTKIYLQEIGILLIESTAVSLTSYLLNELIKRKIKIIFCDEKRNPSSELLPYYGSHDTSIRLQRQIEWTQEDKTTVWTKIVREKIWQQAVLLEKLQKQEAELLKEYIQEVKEGDISNRE